MEEMKEEEETESIAVCLFFTFFASTFKAVKEYECVVWGYLLNYENQNSTIVVYF